MGAFRRVEFWERAILQKSKVFKRTFRLAFQKLSRGRLSFFRHSGVPSYAGAMEISKVITVPERRYIQLPLRQWGAANVYLIVMSS